MSKKQRVKLPRRDGLVGEWLLNGNALDTSGSGNNGTATNVTYATTYRGYQSQAGVFNGSSSKVVSSANYGLAADSNFTISIVFNSSVNQGATSYIIGNYSTTTGVSSIELIKDYNGTGVENGKITLIRRNNLNVYVTTPFSYVLGKDHHIVITNDSSRNVEIFLDGERVHSGTNPYSGTSTSGFYVMHANNNTNWVNGRLQSVRIFNRALSQNEIRDWYEEGLRYLGGASLYGLTDGLVAYFDFKGDADDIVSNNVPSSNTASLIADYLGNPNGGYSFDGTKNILVPDSNSLDLTSCTIICGVGTSASTLGTVLRKGYEAANQSNYQIDLTADGKMYWRTVGSAGRAHITAAGAVPYGNSHIAVTCAHGDTTPSFYVNGNSVSVSISDGSSATYTMAGNANSLVIGSASDGVNKFVGNIYYVAIFNQKKSAAEVKALYDLFSKSKLLPFS